MMLHEATVAKYATVQTEGIREVERQIEYFNLETIFAMQECLATRLAFSED